MSMPDLPFAAAEYAARLERVRRRMGERGLDVLLVSSAQNYYYLTGYQSGISHSLTFLVLPLEGEPVWVLRKTELSNVRALAPAMVAKEGVGVDDSADFMEVLAEILRQRCHERSRIGIELEAQFLGVASYLRLRKALPDVDFQDATGLVEQLRSVKSEAERRYLRAAGEITAKTLTAGFDALSEGMTDRELSAILVATAIREGSERMGMMPFVSSGPRTALAHASWIGQPIRRGEVINAELATAVARYHTPVFRVGSIGEPSEEIRRMHAASEKGLAAGLAGIKPGMTSHEADRVVRDAIEKTGYGELFVVRAAYSIGIAFAPSWGENNHVMSIRPHDKRVLEPGMCFHLVPALYKEGTACVCCSMPIEITQSGVRPLTPIAPELFVR